MTIQQLREDKALKNEVFRKSLASHQLSVMFGKETNKTISALERKTDYSWKAALILWQLKYERFIQPETKKWNTKKDDSVEMLSHLNDAFVILKLRYGLHQKTRKTIFPDKDSNLFLAEAIAYACLLYTSPSPRDRTRSRMPSSA